MHASARSVLGVLGALTIAAALPASSLAAPQPVAVPDCAGALHARPSSIVFACGDGNFSASGLRWTGWGEPFAAAVGVGEVNDCTPNCAAGKMHHARIVLIAGGSQRCAGRAAYRTVTYAWVGPPPGPVGADPVVAFPCSPPR